jgi:RNA polymerase sigma-70 factor (ECF subfamily)
MPLFTAYHKKTNEQLMILVADGDHRAFSHIYDRFSGRLKGFFFRMLGADEKAAEDAVHDLFTKIIQRPDVFDTTKVFESWIFTVASNQCKNIYRKRSFEQTYRQELEKQGVTLPVAETKIDQDIEKDLLDQAIERLSEEKRSMFLLRYQQELSVKELAGIFDIPEGTVKSRLHQIRMQLVNQVTSQDQRIL